MNSKAKGSAFEREVAKRLTKGLTGQEKELNFGRSSNSGGTFTVNKGLTKQISGDLCGLTAKAMEICDKINFELKTGYEKADLNLHLKSNKNEPLRDFGEQSCRDAKLVNKEPFVIFRKKGFKNIGLGISVNLFQKFPTLKNYRFIMLTWGKDFDLEPVMFMNFEEFLSEITPEMIFSL